MLTRKLASALLVTAMALLGLPAAGAEETPKTFPGGGLVSIEQAKSMLDKGAQFVDSRVAAEYAEKHIKSALSVPFKEEFPKVSKTGAGDHMDAAKLPSDKNKVLIFGSSLFQVGNGVAAPSGDPQRGASPSNRSLPAMR